MMKYERLTERKSNNGTEWVALKEFVKYQDFVEWSNPHAMHAFKKALDRLAELEDKIEQGTLIEFNMKMPFKVGNTAYWLNGLPNCIQEYKVLGYIFDYSSGVRVDLGYFQPILFRVFGENLFASREEAKKRLKELQE